MDEIFNKLKEQLKNKNLTEEEKIQLIEQAGNEYRKKVDEELNKYLARQYLGATLEIGSAAIPVGGVGKFGAEIGLSFLKPYLGRKISQEIGAGSIGGYLSGSIFGFGRGLFEDKNPFITSIVDANKGMILGGILGRVSGQIAKTRQGNILQQYEGNVLGYSKDLKKQFNQDAKRFYQDYIQERVLDKNGKFSFSRPGLEEILSQNPNQAKNFPTLVDDIKNATRLPDAPNIKPEQKPNVSHYEVYQGKNGKHKIEVMQDKNRRYYFTQDNTPKEAIPKNVRDRNESANNIIQHIPQNFNPSQMTIPTLEAINIPMPEEESHVFKVKIEKSVDLNGNPIFNPQEIGDMTPEEFSQNEVQIMSQLKNGQIKNEPQKIDYSTYKNPQTDKGTIYTREDISKMTTKEFTQHEKEINEQMRSIGIPYKKDLPKGTKTYSNSNNTTQQNSNKGHWVTINGNHVFMED